MARNKIPFVLGHRGCVELPENTLPAFDHALKFADGIEFDIWKTKDGELVVIHDETVDRTTNGEGNIGDFTLAELQALEVKQANGEVAPGVSIPSLKEVLDLVSRYAHQGKEKWCNIELKGEDVAGDVVNLVQDYIISGQLAANHMVISSFNHDLLCEVKEKDESLQRGLLYEPWDEENLSQLVQEIAPYSIHPNLEDLAAGKTNISAFSHPVWVWCGGESQFSTGLMQSAIEKEVDIIITNFPKETKQLLEQGKWKQIVKNQAVGDIINGL